MHNSETTENPGFEAWEQQAIASAAVGNTRKSIAETVGKSLPKLRRFLRTSEASKAIRDIRTERFEELQSKLSHDFHIVLLRVQTLLNSEDENVVLKAASWLRQVLFDARNIDIEAQLAELESQVKELRS